MDLHVPRVMIYFFAIGSSSYGSCERPRTITPKPWAMLCRARVCDTYYYLIMGFVDVEILDRVLPLLGMGTLNVSIGSHITVMEMTDMCSSLASNEVSTSF